MGWATKGIEDLLMGKTVQLRPRGRSMTPIINDKDLVTLRPVKAGEQLRVKDIVLCNVKGNVYLHKIIAKSAKGRYLIGNNKGGQNGYASRIYGIVTKVEK